ncbi:Major facilitator superfamily (MFS) profile domain-containing protein [Plasmodiophora brassicae]|uniref:Major facilitator superfamily (MFS) profile domain-containing protein n=1 Tax=Plasmodiophora brassicae TaxID=37360 RepID=A0A0G4J6B8_PLABS|nr:hypothetical protein PBRA_002902 [Plasmodiophora brassicae]SPQ95037.1 unnamed protein product [Plasmodiophora brassicae]
MSLLPVRGGSRSFAPGHCRRVHAAHAICADHRAAVTCNSPAGPVDGTTPTAMPSDTNATCAYQPVSDTVPKQASAGPTTRPRITAVVVLCMLSLVLALPLSLVGPFFPGEAVRHDVSLVAAGAILSVFPFAVLVTAPMFGMLIPILGPKALILTGSVVTGISTAAFALIDDFNGTPFVVSGFAIRIIQGIGSAASSTGSDALMTSMFTGCSIGKMAGFLEVCGSIGFMFGPFLGGFLFEYGGFQLPFFVVGALTLTTVIPLMWLIPRRDKALRKRSQVTVYQIMTTPGVALIFAASVVGMTVFSFLDLALQPELASQNVSPSSVGLLFVMISFIYALAAPAIGWVSTPANTRGLIVFGLSLVAASLCVLGPAPVGFIPRALSLRCGSLVFLSAGAAMVLVPVVPQMVELTKHLGAGATDVVSGVVIASYSLGEIIGPVVGGALLQYVGMSLGASIFATCILGIALAILAAPMLPPGSSSELAKPLLAGKYPVAEP